MAHWLVCLARIASEALGQQPDSRARAPELTMEKYQDELATLGISEYSDVNLKDLRRAFKKKSLAMLPEKHPTVANAHTQFEEVNAAFVKVNY